MLPANQHFITITIPNGVSYEVFQTAAHPGWDSKNEFICKAFAQAWYDERRSALLIVPSIPTRIERNFLINPIHADAKHITHTMPEPVWWDARLYHAAQALAPEAKPRQRAQTAEIDKHRPQLAPVLIRWPEPRKLVRVKTESAVVPTRAAF